jgi:two-component system KDP operon response regulator KdpE
VTLSTKRRIAVVFLTQGAAALATVPFRPIRPDLSLPFAGNAEGAMDAQELGDLVRRLEDVVRWLRGRNEGDEPPGAVLRFGNVEVEPATQVIRREGRRVAVTRTEFRLLYALMRRPGEVVPREQLMTEVWGPGVRLRSRAIDTHIARLRRKLEADPAAPRHIRTAPYRGYRFDPHGG